jgi:hypothetical protein
MAGAMKSIRIREGIFVGGEIDREIDLKIDLKMGTAPR